jgi:hypothetical protein
MLVIKIEDNNLRNHLKIILVLALLFFVSCIGGGSSVRKASGFKVNAPSDWRVLEKNNQDSAYALPSGSIATISSSCDRYEDVSLEVLTRHLLFDLKSINVKKKERIRIKEHEGLFTSLTAKIEKAKVDMDVFVIVINKCIFDFTLTNNKNLTESDSKEFLNFIESLNYGQ